MVVVVVVIVRSFARSFGVVSRSLERLCVCKVGSSVVELAVVYSSFASLFVCVGVARLFAGYCSSVVLRLAVAQERSHPRLRDGNETLPRRGFVVAPTIKVRKYPLTFCISLSALNVPK